MQIDKNTPACDMTIGGNIYDAGNAIEFKTGDWRSMKPVFLSDKSGIPSLALFTYITHAFLF